MKRKAEIPVTWQCRGIMTIEYETSDEIEDTIMETDLPTKWRYIDDSFEVDVKTVGLYNDSEITKEVLSNICWLVK